MKEFLDNYKVYEDGRVQRVGSIEGDDTNPRVGKFLKQEKTKTGYMRVSLCYKGRVKRFLTHRLVAMVHLPNPNKHPVVNHKNRCRSDNRIENLEWCTYSHNNQLAYDLGKDRLRGELRYNAKLTYEKVKWLRECKDPDLRKLAKEWGVSYKHLRDVHSGRKWAYVK